MQGRLKHSNLLVLFLHILTQQVALSHSTSVCMHHLGCYRDNFLHLNHVTSYHSYETERTAENCVKLCLHREPSSEVVLVKLVNIGDLLMCGCGGHQALGNGTGLTFDLLGCYLCPDSLAEKCGSEDMSSAYQIERYSSEPCNRVLVVPPPITTTTTTTTTTATTTTTTATTTKPPTAVSKGEDSLSKHPNNDHNYSSKTQTSPNNGLNYPITSSGDPNYLPNKPSLPNDPQAGSNTTNEHLDANYQSNKANYPTNNFPNLRYIGCYDEDNVNQSLVVTVVVSSGYSGSYGSFGLNYCNSNCSRSFPSSEVLLVKILGSDTLYCGCGKLAALPSIGDFKNDNVNSSSTSNQCTMSCGRGRTSLPCGGWTYVSVYERNSQGSLSLSLYSLSFFLSLSLSLTF